MKPELKAYDYNLMRQTGAIIIFLLFIFNINSFGQVKKKKKYFPIWTFHQDSIDIYGIAVGLWTLNIEPRYTNTDGIKFELIGVGLGIPLIPRSPIVESDSAYNKLKKEPLSERINGLNISSFGTACRCLTNGITAGFLAQIHYQVNGISASLFMNFTQKHNGIMAAIFNDAFYMNGLQIGYTNYGFHTKGLQMGLIDNNSKEMNGLQIGLFNKSEKLKGLQIGLWNVNNRRKFPLINWNFK